MKWNFLDQCDFSGQAGRKLGGEGRKKDGPKRNNKFKCELKKKCQKLNGKCKKDEKIEEKNNCPNFVLKGCKKKPNAPCTCCLKTSKKFDLCFCYFVLFIYIIPGVSYYQC